MADAVIQLRELQAQHGELQSAYTASQAELRELRELVDASISLQSQDAQTARIIELSKKNRALVLSLEKEKQRASKLQADLQQAQRAAKQPLAGAANGGAMDPTTLEGIARSMVERAAEAAEAASKEAAGWKERYQQQTNKVAQMEQKVFSLEIEAKRLTRALVREVGEEVPLAKVLDEASPDWKGRREQIVALRHQVQALKAAQGLAPESKLDAAARKTISKVTGAKSAEMEALRAELAAARQEAEAARTRAEGAVSRRKILEAELSGMKEKVAVVLAKTQNDDRLIAALRAELASVHNKLVAPQPGASAAQRPPVEQDDELWHELSSLRRRCAEHRGQLERYEGTIQQLNDRLAVAATAAPATATTASSPAGQRSKCPHCGGQLRPSSSNPASSRGGTPPAAAAHRPASGSSVLNQHRPSGSPACLETCGSGVWSQNLAGGASGPRASVGRTFSGQDGCGGREQWDSLPRAVSLRQSQQGASLQGRVSCQGEAGAAGGAAVVTLLLQATGQTPVEVREAAAAQQLRVAEVEIRRLQELVQLLRTRVSDLEDEVQEAG